MSNLHFTLIQSNLHWEDKQANRKMFEEKINLCKDKMEVVILPEAFTTGFSMKATQLAEGMEGETIQWMSKMAKKHRIILCGSFICQDQQNFYNRFVWMQPDGEFSYYDKRHLFSFAGEDKEFAAGSKRLIAQVKGWKICTLICYDLRFPVWSRQTKENEYDVLLYVANWPEQRTLAWETLLVARAIENQCYVVAVNRIGEDGNQHKYIGQSCVISPLGEVMYKKSTVEDVFTLSLDKGLLEEIRSKFPFQKDKDGFFLM